jgi:hypothetical protein
MLIALQLCVALVLTATLVTVVTVLAAFQLGRLVTRDDEQRQVDAADAPQIRKDARLARPKRAIHDCRPRRRSLRSRNRDRHGDCCVETS